MKMMMMMIPRYVLYGNELARDQIDAGLIFHISVILGRGHYLEMETCDSHGKFLYV
jgi:hypothetical protein